MTQGDAQLYVAWTQGDREAGAQLIDRYLSAVTRFFANKAVAPSDIEDLVATTFERCARSLGSVTHPERFRNYVFGVATNVLRDAIRKRRPTSMGDLEQLSVRDLSPSPSAVVVDRAEQRLLLHALRAIPIEHQIVLELSVFEQMSRSEIAEVLGFPAGTVASRLRRARVLVEQQVEILAESPELCRSTIHDLEDWAVQIRQLLDRPS
ncbi:MAG: sigma-70 family RNA polymerase sigma factor [Myxococcota bacterium]